MADRLTRPEITPSILDELEYWQVENCDDEDDPLAQADRWRFERWPADHPFFAGMSWRCLSEVSKFADRAHEDARMQKIRDWIDEVGGVDAAFAINPPIILQKEASYEKIDGWHRLKIALVERKASAVWVLVGTPRGIDQHILEIDDDLV